MQLQEDARLEGLRERKKERTRDAIRDAAHDLFVEQGLRRHDRRRHRRGRRRLAPHLLPLLREQGGGPLLPVRRDPGPAPGLPRPAAPPVSRSATALRAASAEFATLGDAVGTDRAGFEVFRGVRGAPRPLPAVVLPARSDGRRVDRIAHAALAGGRRPTARSPRCSPSGARVALDVWFEQPGHDLRDLLEPSLAHDRVRARRVGGRTRGASAGRSTPVGARAPRGPCTSSP